jgi:hypothetical protein
MDYRRIKPHAMTEQELRKLWKEEYCDPSSPIYTLDDIHVKFFEDMFDHAFYESDSRKARDKSILSFNRLEKMLWIKDTLVDPDAILKQGWDRDRKVYDGARRVAFIKDSYVVVIRFTGHLKAKFVTAYEIQSERTIQIIQCSPDWVSAGILKKRK